MNYMLVCKLISRTGYTFFYRSSPSNRGGGAVFLSFFCFFCCVHCSDESPKHFTYFVYIPAAVDFCGIVMFVLSQIEKKHCDIIMS